MEIFKTYILPWVWFLGLIYGFTFILKGLIDHTKRQIATAFSVRAQLYFGFLGIWIHELSHALFAVIFHHHIVDMKLMEYRVTGENVTLGHVDHAFNKRSVYQVMGNFFIGIGPLIGCSAFLIGAFRLLVPDSFHQFAQSLTAFVQQPDLSDLGQQLWLNLQQMPWHWETFLFWLLLILTTMGFGLSMADIKNSLTGLPYILILCTLTSLIAFFLKFNLILSLTKLNLVIALVLSIILGISILYNLFISLLCHLF